METLGFIGCGNMAQPIIRNAAEKLLSPDRIFVFDTDTAKLSAFCSQTGVNAAESAAACVLCDAAVLAVKPQVFPAVLPEIAETVAERDTLLISIAAGKTTGYIEGFFEKPARVCRIFPNLNANVGSAVSAYTGGRNASAADVEFTGALAGCFGEAIALDEADFSAFGVLGGCAPAYTFMYIDSLYRAGLAHGLPEDAARRAAVGVVLGSAKLIAEMGGDLDEWVKKVCSPGGTTIEGVNSLRADDLAEIINRAFDKSYRRDLELSS